MDVNTEQGGMMPVLSHNGHNGHLAEILPCLSFLARQAELTLNAEDEDTPVLLILTVEGLRLCFEFEHVNTGFAEGRMNDS